MGASGMAWLNYTKPKDLVGIPWAVAFALRADGWFLRSEIVWSKLNPMPESVTDRPTKSHEQIFLLTKNPRYYFDADAVRETSIDPESHEGYSRAYSTDAIEVSGDGGYDGHRTRMGIKALKTSGKAYPSRNIRTVWTIATEAFPEAHFATYPRKLVEPCIKAGSKDGDTILDPFSGSGTTGVVALSLGRSFVGIELNPEYAAMAERRLSDVSPLLATTTVERPAEKQDEMFSEARQ